MQESSAAAAPRWTGDFTEARPRGSSVALAGYPIAVRTTLPTARELRRLAGELEDALNRGIDDAQAWLASPTGRRFRALAARGLLLATPMILRHPFFKTPLGRVIEVGGAAALVTKVAEGIRDWEPAGGAVRA
jgi:hypothetical protein